MRKEEKKTEKKTEYVTRVGMTVLTAILIVLFLWIMALVGKIQGTARVVNYAGLVRGETQRMIKLENAGYPQDRMSETIHSYIKGLREGSDELNFVRLDDAEFQDKMKELDDYFQILKEEVSLVREKGYQQTNIIEKSEKFFKICDKAVGRAEVYSQRLASALDRLERIVIVDIAGLLILIGMELIKAVRYAAQNRILQSKVYLDEATGLPNKNKCEELLNAEGSALENGISALCVFDLNNLRRINNNLGHDKGDEYIRSFAVQLRGAVPPEQFVGRDGGDEFLVILRGLDGKGVRMCLQNICEQTEEYSKEHPEMPISYAVGYAMAQDFEECTMRELFRYADKNMYVDKNRAKIEEAAQYQQLKFRLLDEIKAQNLQFSDCLYCDALLDQYSVLRATADFYLAEEGSYSGAVEKIVEELSCPETRRELWHALQLPHLQQVLTRNARKLELPCQYEEDGKMQRGRVTLLFTDTAKNGRLHHFILGFERFHNEDHTAETEKTQLMRYYEQMKQSILENESYVDALLGTAESVYTVDLTHDCLEKIFYHTQEQELPVNLKLPCSYDAYCEVQKQYIAEETLENYRIVDSSEKLLDRFANGEKQITVEYRVKKSDGVMAWIQKMVLFSRETMYDSRTGQESAIIHAIILFKNTSSFHEKEEQEKERLEAAFQEADLASRTKTEFLNRMSHDIRTPINGIIGMLEIIKRSRTDERKVDECLDKIRISISHLLALVNDVLDMSKIKDESTTLEQEKFELEQLMEETDALVSAQLLDMEITYHAHRERACHTMLVGSPLQLRQVLVNLLSNAIKYNKKGGKIDTYTKEFSVDGDTVWYEFRITDTGVGMSEKFVKEELFKPFTQEKSGARTQYKGTGLGMSIVKGLVEKMNGTIEVQSVPGQGSTFTVTLPFRIGKAEPSKEQETEQKQEKLLTGKRILLVEDNEINMEIAQFYLEDGGAAVDIAWNGAQAVNRFAASKEGYYDMILMDVMMPVMDGLEACRRIRALEQERREHVCIYAMTAQASSESEQQCLEAGMDGHIAKPIEAEELVKTILTVTGKEVSDTR